MRREVLLSEGPIEVSHLREREPVSAEKPRKYNDPASLDELCKKFLQTSESDPGAAIEYCKGFLSMLREKPPTTGAVVSARSKPR